MEFILGYASLQSLILIYLLASGSKKNHPAFVYLTALLVISTYIGSQYLASELYPEISKGPIFLLGVTPIFLIPTAYVLFLASILDYDRFTYSRYLLFLPFIIFGVNELSGYQFIVNKRLIFFSLILLLAFCSFISYKLLSKSTLSRGADLKTLSVLNHIVLFFSVSLTIYFAGNIFLGWHGIDTRVLTIIFLVAFVTFLEIHMARNFKKFLWLGDDSEKYKVSNLQAHNTGKIKSDLEHLLKEEEVFRDPDLTLNTLSQMLSINRHQLTEFLNQEMDLTFNELVNSYRIEYFNKSVKAGKHIQMSITGLAEESGFKSKSTFYRVFKKSTGSTPSEFINTF